MRLLRSTSKTSEENWDAEEEGDMHSCFVYPIWNLTSSKNIVARVDVMLESGRIEFR